MGKDKQDWINQYFEGRLSEVQKAEFDALLQQDSEWAEAFQFEKEVRAAVVKQERSSLKAELKALERHKPMSVFLLHWWKAAAAVLLLLGLAGTLWLTLRPGTPERLYAQYAAPYPNVVSPAVRGEQASNVALAEALALYDAKNYAAAAQKLEQLYVLEPQKTTAFYWALCLLFQQQAEEALALLEQWDWTADDQPSAAVVYWYQALAYLQMNQADQALERFLWVSRSEDSLATAARDIIKVLERL